MRYKGSHIKKSLLWPRRHLLAALLAVTACAAAGIASSSGPLSALADDAAPPASLFPTSSSGAGAAPLAFGSAPASAPANFQTISPTSSAPVSSAPTPSAPASSRRVNPSPSSAPFVDNSPLPPLDRDASSAWPQGKSCYLTFDDGPSANTPAILDILARKKAKATFFVIHSRFDYYKKIADSGNAIGLHCYTHDYSAVYAGDAAYFKDLYEIHDLVRQRAGQDVRIVRFPGGSSNTISEKYCPGIMTRIVQAMKPRFVYYDWNVDSRDSSASNVPADTIVRSVVMQAKTKPHIIVLMHDTGTKGSTVQALPEILDQLGAMGFRFYVISPKAPQITQTIAN